MFDTIVSDVNKYRTLKAMAKAKATVPRPRPRPGHPCIMQG